jgi:hypothetical protein
VTFSKGEIHFRNMQSLGMVIARLGFLFAAAALGICAQTIVPSFTRAGALPTFGTRAQRLMPGEVIAIRGRNFALPCPSSQPPPDEMEHVKKWCGTEVTVAGMPAGLLEVQENLVLLKIPAGAPTSGEAAIVVTVNGVGSQPVMVPFGRLKVLLSVAGPAYVHMPVWITLERPYPYDVLYPYSANPTNFGGGRFEVRRNGALLRPIKRYEADRDYSSNGLANGTIAPPGSPHGRLPLHLQYRFDVPGKYEVRFIGTMLESAPGGMSQVQVDESDWTEIELLPYSEVQRRDWMQQQISHMPSSPGLLVGDAVPGLLALPDQLALHAIAPALYHADDAVRYYVAASLPSFDDTLVSKELTPLIREKGLTEEIARILDRNEDLFEGGHQALLAILPGFLNSASTSAQTGALSYLAMMQGREWAKTPVFRSQSNAMVLSAVTNVFDHGDARSQQVLAGVLGSMGSDVGRDFLWKMIENGKAKEQSEIALTWIGDARDLPRLANLMTIADPADPYGYKNAPLANPLHHAYGEKSLPYLKRIARDTAQIWVRTACARELVFADQPEGFQLLLQAMDEMPSFKPEAMRFFRDQFPNYGHASEDAILTFIKTRARAR